jgi:hypothetical protein
MSSNFGEIIKKLTSVFGRKPARGLPKPPPTTLRPDSAAFTRGENAKYGRGARNPPTGLRRGEKGRGGKYCLSLKVPKCEIFDRSDIDDFYTTTSLCEDDFEVKIKKNCRNIFRGSFRGAKFLTRMLSLFLRRFFL